MAETNAFKLKIISPDRIFYEGEAIMLELNTMDGIVGIYKNHMPMTYIIEPGIMTITESEESKKEAAQKDFGPRGKAQAVSWRHSKRSGNGY